MRLTFLTGLLFLALVILFSGCSHDRTPTFPYRGADQFHPPGNGPGNPADTVLAFKIATLHDELQGHITHIPITKTAGKERVYYLDFTFGYDAVPLQIMGITRGPLYDIPGQYEWEYFTYRLGPLPGCDSNCPSGQIRVICLADQNDGPHHPRNYRIPDETTLFTLDFLVTNDRTYECQFFPIQFLWLDCGDNMMLFLDDTSESISQLEYGFSRFVYDQNGNRIDAVNPFPSFTGVGNLCDTVSVNRPTRKYIDFWNGGVDIICTESASALGDINLNGIAYELGDAYLFSNYFIDGPGVFEIDPDSQSLVSDVNVNGIPLELADFVYLIRVIIGDAIPVADPIYEPLLLTVDEKNLSIAAHFPVGAIYLTLDGIIDASLTGSASDMSMKIGYRDGATHLLLYSFELDQTINSGPILQANSNIRIIRAEVASYYGRDFKTIIIGNPGDSLIVTATPNPFSDSTLIAFTPSDLTANDSGWRCQIFNLSGIKIWEYDSHPDSSSNFVVWKPENLSEGIYYLRLTAGSLTGRLTLIHKLE